MTLDKVWVWKIRRRRVEPLAVSHTVAWDRFVRGAVTPGSDL